YYPGVIGDGTISGSVTVIENGKKYSGEFKDVYFDYSGPDPYTNCYTISIDDMTIVSETLESKTLQFNSDLIAYLIQ
nr:hypothetical protein [Spirochaetota bacterium]